MKEQIHISYKLVGSGWSECRVETNNGRAELSASYLSDALGNLVRSAIAVVSCFHIVEFGFDEEPGEYRWSMNALGNNFIRLRVVEFPELWGNKPTETGRLLLEEIITILDYAKAVHACAITVLQEYGLVGYAEKWAEHQFPERELAILGDLIAELNQ
jgi:hypothetical protein